MKKTLLAAALLAGFATAGVAQAETSVTLYGILDTGYGYSQYKYDHNNVNLKNTTSGLRDGFLSGNRFGLKGSEDLGDGLRAIFVLEQGFTIGNGEPNSSKQFHRQAFVGLSSDNWGTFTMGRQYNFGDGYHDANFGSSFGDMDKAFGAKSVRVDKMFKYETPNFAGFQAGIGYAADGSVLRTNNALVTTGSFDKVTGLPKTTTKEVTGDRSNYLTAGLKYSNGPIFAGATYDRVGGSGTGNDFAVTNWMISGGYDFEVVKLGLGYGQDRNGKLNGMLGTDFGGVLGDTKAFGIDGFKSHNYYVGLSAPLGGGTAVATWTRSSSNLDDAYADANPGKTLDTKAQNIYSLKYTYPLSKRTEVYAYGAYGTGVAYLDGLKAKEAGIGMRHKF